MTSINTYTARDAMPDKPIIPNQKCTLCSCHSDRPLCVFCQSEITRYRPTVCAGNLMNLPDFTKQLKPLKGFHLFSLGPHTWPLDHLISTLKYQHKSVLIEELATLFVTHFRSTGQTKPEAIIAVPMHPLKIWIRGFNQSAMLANHIGRQLNIPVLYNIIHKRWSWVPQMKKSATQRRQLRLNQFKTSSAPLNYKKVAIFDDVITTGTTMARVAGSLQKRHPDTEIEFWSCSVSQPHQ